MRKTPLDSGKLISYHLYHQDSFTLTDVFVNIMLSRTPAATKVLPLQRDDFETVVSQEMTPDKVKTNLQAYDMGARMIN